jgi:hypothetical protein
VDPSHVVPCSVTSVPSVFFISYLGSIKVYYNILLCLMLFLFNLKTYMCWIWANLSKMALRATFVITYLVLVVILYYYSVYVFLMQMYCYCLILCCFLYLLFCFLILCLISVHVLYVWSGYVIDDLAFSCRLKCCFVSCFLCVKEAIRVILFVFVLYLCFRYMYLRMLSKCCECSWK